MRVINCIVTLHDPWLVALAALVCVAGGWVSLRLHRRGLSREGRQQLGWYFLAAVAAGASVWCTHFIAILAYDPQAPVTFEPVLTMVSLLTVIAGAALSFQLTTGRAVPSALSAGALLGLAVAAMHYSGMMAYRVDGIVTWDVPYVVASIAFAAVFGGLAMLAATRDRLLAALLLFVICVVSLHFTGMAAVAVEPFVTGAPIAGAGTTAAMAVAVAGVALLIVGTGVASYMIDSDTAERNVETLRQMALSDALTGLPNRVSFHDRAQREIERAGRQGQQVAIVGIDLDKFKEVNDVRGHDAGDEALRLVASRLAGMLRDDEFVARVGGDEFVAIKRFCEASELRDFVGRLERELYLPAVVDGFEIILGASLGVSIFPHDGTTVARLVSNADLAMYRAKAEVNRSICYYEAEMDDAARARRDLAMDLRQAVARNELELHFQVQESVARRGEIVGYEVLLRWHHPQRGNVSPAEFIPIAEESGSILEIGEWVLREACRAAAGWKSEAKIAVNISAIQLSHCDLPRLVQQVLAETGLAAERLELEITESSIIQDKERSLLALLRIRALGVTIAIDDFGVGYSSLDTLRSFPFDRIKLDRSFMREVEDSAQARAIIRAVLALGRSLDISVLAEGVENEKQLELLRLEGCHEAQGYLLGRPAPIAAQAMGRTVEDKAAA